MLEHFAKKPAAVVYIRLAILLAALIAVTTMASLWMKHDDRPIHQSKNLSIYGVIFRIEDQQAIVFPSNYVSPDEKFKSIPLVSNIGICANLPDFSLRADRLSDKECLSIGRHPSSVSVISISGVESKNLRLPENGRTALGLVLRGRLNAERVKNDDYSLEEGDDLYGLNWLYPIGPGVKKNTGSMFWRGTNLDSAETLIECAGYLERQHNNTFKNCVHDFQLSEADAKTPRITVRLYYHHLWLPRWKELETNAKQAIAGMRVRALNAR